MNATVLDYGSGNLHSVIKALREAGSTVTVAATAREALDAQRLVLPGVGAFEDGMRGMQERGLADAVLSHCAHERPFLGICLGMQMLLTRSSEFGDHTGLNLIPGSIVEIPRKPGLKVPHVGWSEIQPPADSRWTCTPLEGTTPGTRFYFVHSFSATPDRDEDRLADTQYGDFQICAAVGRGLIFGLQFHPEKSGPDGIAILRRFLAR